MRDPRSLWRYTGVDRPPFAVVPAAGEESVWDYPRPPRIAPDAREVIVRIGDLELARTRRALRMLETASPPTFYIPLADAHRELLVPSPASHFTMCEWKGRAQYWSIIAGDGVLRNAAWGYPSPLAPHEQLTDHFSLYPAIAACFVDGERVRPQEGGFYGGWVTREVVGPWKGGPGTSGW